MEPVLGDYNVVAWVELGMEAVVIPHHLFEIYYFCNQELEPNENWLAAVKQRYWHWPPDKHCSAGCGMAVLDIVEFGLAVYSIFV